MSGCIQYEIPFFTEAARAVLPAPSVIALALSADAPPVVGAERTLHASPGTRRVVALHITRLRGSPTLMASGKIAL